MSSERPSRLPVRWSTHSLHILMVLTVALGGTMFGLAFAMWPQSTFDRWLGGVILAGVVAMLVWVVWFLARPVRR